MCRAATAGTPASISSPPPALLSTCHRRRADRRCRQPCAPRRETSTLTRYPPRADRTRAGEINALARTSGNDVILDALLLRLHTETACRRGGALALRLVDLDMANGLVRLTEKGSTVRWQPITLDLAGHLREHADARGAVLHTDALLRGRNGQPITSRRYDHLWKRLGQRLPWVAVQGISTGCATPP
ncbi:tyrosine-type recombinase/integrase [Micromonospora sp. NPDC051296]|uniref:tyrosine-type recombinase/integrase n=1 Tax=Micromonospora sp. NPDC051296 TaxID=3155046 RepID=UPI00344444B0